MNLLNMLIVLYLVNTNFHGKQPIAYDFTTVVLLLQNKIQFHEVFTNTPFNSIVFITDYSYNYYAVVKKKMLTYIKNGCFIL